LEYIMSPSGSSFSDVQYFLRLRCSDSLIRCRTQTWSLSL